MNPKVREGANGDQPVNHTSRKARSNRPVGRVRDPFFRLGKMRVYPVGPLGSFFIARKRRAVHRAPCSPTHPPPCCTHGAHARTSPA